jgi:magnesium transporter
MSEIAGIRKRVGKIGLIPGELIQSGDSESNVTISVFDYDKSFFVEKKIADIAECFEFRNKPSATWINIDGNFSKEVLEQLGHCYGIHPLVLEDIMTCGQRPKFEDYGDYLFIVIKMIYPDSNNNTIDEQLSLLIGSNYVISIQEKPNGDPFNIIRERIRKDLGKIRKTGVDYLAYSIMDIVVDNYYLSLEKTGEKIESHDAATNSRIKKGIDFFAQNYLAAP